MSDVVILVLQFFCGISSIVLKPSYYLAIQFVLSDEYNNLRAEQRQQLLHVSNEK